MSENRDEIIAKDKWVFDDKVARVFDDMLQRSIPDYNSMRNLVYAVGRNFVNGDKPIIDVGCSNGKAALPFVRTFKNPAILLDTSESMLDLCKREFEHDAHVTVQKHDIRNGARKKCVSDSVGSDITIYADRI